MTKFLIAVPAMLLVSSSALGVAPFTEGFSASSSSWYNADASAPVGWAGGGYATTSFNMLNSAPDATPAFFRAQDEFNSSGNAFAGNYIADGITQLTYQVRHNAPTPLSFFARIAGPGNFPAVAALEFAPVLPNTWTTITVNITNPNPSFIYEGPPSTYASVFSNVGHIQIGAIVPGSIAGQDLAVNFDLDNVSIVPAPASALGLLGLGLGSRRRRTI